MDPTDSLLPGRGLTDNAHEMVTSALTLVARQRVELNEQEEGRTPGRRCPMGSPSGFACAARLMWSVWHGRLNNQER
jgi:hypothetical protein